MSENRAIDAELEAFRGTSLTSLVRKRIEDDIISGRLKGGAHMSEASLTKQLGVSRGPVREALRALEGQGLLEQQKNRGWFVKTLNANDIADVFEMREILDDGMVRLLIARCSDSTTDNYLHDLEALVTQMDNAITARSPSAYAKLNQEFHDLMLAMIGNDHLTKTYRNMMGELASHVVDSLALEGAMRMSNDEHRAMIHAIARRDAEALRHVFYQHRSETARRMETTIPVDRRFR